MKRISILLIVPMLMFMMLGVIGCSNEDENVQCYTVTINGMDENDIVSGNIVHSPENSPFFKGGSIVFFDKSDLTRKEISKGDQIDIIILSYKNVSIEGHQTGIRHFYRCEVKECK
ncbi:MAG: hypothetical protein IJK87_00305 [Prevotella sp.]|nr:hypothetical protein [Prevotella sp.]